MPQKITKKQAITADRIRTATLLNYDSEKRTARLSFASETPVKDPWYGKEILRVNEESVDRSRFEAGVMPVLFNHNRNNVIARIDDIEIKDGVAYADITFDEDEFSDNIRQKVENGSLRGVSVGYAITQYSIVERDNKTADGIEGPALIAERWEVFEVSIVSIPADASVGVGRSRLYNPDLIVEAEEGPEEGRAADPDEPAENPAPEPEQRESEEGDNTMTPEERAALEAEIRNAELTRQRSIREMCAQHNISADDMNTMLNDSSCTIERANARALEILATRNAPVPTPDVTVTADEADKKRAAIVDGLYMRHTGINLEHPADGANEFRNARFSDIARMCLEDAGEHNVRFMPERELFARALSTTSTLSAIADGIANKSLSNKYNSVGTTYGAWTQTGSNSDFKIAKRYRIYDELQPTKIPEGGEFTYDELKDESAGVQLETFGEAMAFTREMMINDDLHVLAKTVPAMRNAMERLKNLLVYKALSAAENYDAETLKNLATGAALSTASLGEAAKLMRTQKIGTNTTLNIPPKFLIVPAALEMTAKQILNSIADPAGANSGVYNPFRNSYELIVDATLDNISATAYYLVADPSAVDTIEVSYLNGVTAPIIETGTDFNRLGIQFRMYHDFAVSVLDTRGLVKNPGV